MTRRIYVRAFLALLLLYGGSYMYFSTRGQYVPGSWGFGWVKHYLWAPRGFVYGADGTGNRRLLQLFYLPLWWVDTRLVHTSAKAGGGRYPINTLLDTQLAEQLKKYEKSREAQRTNSSACAEAANRANE